MEKFTNQMDARESTRLASSEPPRMMMMMMGPNPNGVSLPNSSMVSPNSAGIMPNTRLPFNSAINSVSRPYESSSSPYNGDSSLGLTPCGYNTGEPMKKKRGRPRKYATDGNMALALSPLSSVGSPHTNTPSSEPNHKRSRGRPPGSGKKQQLNALGVAGISFVPHVITVKAGEDVASMIMAFSQQGPRTICILSANGAICNVTLRQAATSGGTVTYEGRFEIISLSGSFLLTESDGTRSRAGGLSVLLAGSDGRVLGGGVAGMLMAATPVQVIIGSFLAQGKKSKPDMLKYDNLALPQPPIVRLGPPVVTGSPPSQGTSTESSGESGSPVNRSSGLFNGSGQPIQNMLTFSSIGWGTSHSINPHRHDTDMKMLPN